MAKKRKKKSYVYRVLKDVTKEDLEKLDFSSMPEEIRENSSNFLVKIVMQPKDGEIVQQEIKMMNSEDWQKINLTILEIEEFEKNGIFFNEWIQPDGTSKKYIEENDAAYEMLGLWWLEVDLDKDRLLTFTSHIISEGYCSTRTIDKYCSEVIKTLIDNNLIEKVNVDCL